MRNRYNNHQVGRVLTIKIYPALYSMRRDVHVFVFVTGLLALNWPFLRIFSGHNLPVYLFAAWAAFIGIHALASFISPDG